MKIEFPKISDLITEGHDIDDARFYARFITMTLGEMEFHGLTTEEHSVWGFQASTNDNLDVELVADQREMYATIGEEIPNGFFAAKRPRTSRALAAMHLDTVGVFPVIVERFVENGHQMVVVECANGERLTVRDIKRRKQQGRRIVSSAGRRR